MRTSIVTGLLLVAAAPVVVIMSGALDLELDPMIIAGLGAGAAVGLVPSGRPGARLGALLAGILAAVVGYVVRAAVLPDSQGGLAAAVALTMFLALVVPALTRDRAPVWASLLGAATFAGVFERTYVAAPPEVVSSASTALTSLVLTLGLGFLIASAAGPGRTRITPSPATSTTTQGQANAEALDRTLEQTR